MDLGPTGSERAFGVYPAPDSGPDVSAAIDAFNQQAQGMVNQITQLNADLYAKAANWHIVDLSAQLDAWHNQALAFQQSWESMAQRLSERAAQGTLTDAGVDAYNASLRDLAQQGGDGGALAQITLDQGGLAYFSAGIAEWLGHGTTVILEARRLADLAGDTDWSSTLANFAEEFPRQAQASLIALLKAAGEAGKAAVDAAGDIVDEAARRAKDAAQTAAWGLTSVLLIVGLGIAAVAFALKKSGVRANVGPVSLSEYQQKGIRHVRVVSRSRRASR